MRERLLVIGNGMVGVRLVEDVLARAPGRYDITVFGAEPHPAYSRIMLSPVLAGEMKLDEIFTHDRAWYARNGVALHTGAPVSAIHRDARLVVTADGRSFAYDKLVLATGSDPVRLPVPGSDLPGVVSFRDIADVETMIGAARRKGRRAVIVGGGLLGLEAACGLRARGMAVTVVHLMPHLMERQLDRESGAMLKRALEARGIEIVCPATTVRVLGARRATGVELAGGRRIPADLVVMATGICPRAGLAREAGLAAGRGVCVDARMRTDDPHIFAVGECAEFEGVCHGLVAPLYDMARVLADVLTDSDGAYVHAATATRLKVSGIDLFSAGDFAEGDCEDICLRDPERGAYRRLVLRDNRVIGAVLFGDVADGHFFFDLIRSGKDVSSLRDVLIFGPSLCEAA